MPETAVKTRPIIMSAESVRAIRAGRKIQTRRVMKPQPDGLNEIRRAMKHDADVIAKRKECDDA